MVVTTLLDGLKTLLMRRKPRGLIKQERYQLTNNILLNTIATAHNKNMQNDRNTYLLSLCFLYFEVVNYSLKWLLYLSIKFSRIQDDGALCINIYVKTNLPLVIKARWGHFVLLPKFLFHYHLIEG